MKTMKKIDRHYIFSKSFNIDDPESCKEARVVAEHLKKVVESGEFNLRTTKDNEDVSEIEYTTERARLALVIITRRLSLYAPRKHYREALQWAISDGFRCSADMTIDCLRNLSVLCWRQLEPQHTLDPLDYLSDDFAVLVMRSMTSQASLEDVGAKVRQTASEWLKDKIDADLKEMAASYSPDPGMGTEELLDRRDRALEAGR